MKPYQYPNEISLGAYLFNKIRTTGELHFSADTSEGEEYKNKTKFTFPDRFDIISDFFSENSNRHTCISLKYGRFYYEKINGSILISGQLCVLIAIKKDFQSYKFIGDKPFLQII